MTVTKTGSVEKLNDDLLFFYDRREWTPMILVAMSAVPDEKFVSRKLVLMELENSLKARGERPRIRSSFLMSDINAMRVRGLLERHSLQNYRKSQYQHDKTKANDNYARLVEWGIAEDGRRWMISSDEATRIREELTGSQREELGWLGDVETTGKEELRIFVEENVIGSCKLVGSGTTQTVFRITEKGRQELELHLKQREIKNK
ncbi:hypothetical protein ACFLY1_00655 [Patescibacteria group bacterium]